LHAVPEDGRKRRFDRCGEGNNTSAPHIARKCLFEACAAAMAAHLHR
jgi:hypothetical protein